ncbi:Swi5-domain-containing protein [Bisporella sp. PMI_857]|nr:Swi5-domain-containing protein [Bisporella sp. PMI_857]
MASPEDKKQVSSNLVLTTPSSPRLNPQSAPTGESLDMSQYSEGAPIRLEIQGGEHGIQTLNSSDIQAFPNVAGAASLLQDQDNADLNLPALPHEAIEDEPDDSGDADIDVLGIGSSETPPKVAKKEIPDSDAISELSYDGEVGVQVPEIAAVRLLGIVKHNHDDFTVQYGDQSKQTSESDTAVVNEEEQIQRLAIGGKHQIPEFSLERPAMGTSQGGDVSNEQAGNPKDSMSAKVEVRPIDCQATYRDTPQPFSLGDACERNSHKSSINNSSRTETMASTDEADLNEPIPKVSLSRAESASDESTRNHHNCSMTTCPLAQTSNRRSPMSHEMAPPQKVLGKDEDRIIFLATESSEDKAHVLQKSATQLAQPNEVNLQGNDVSKKGEKGKRPQQVSHLQAVETRTPGPQATSNGVLTELEPTPGLDRSSSSSVLEGITDAAQMSSPVVREICQPPPLSRDSATHLTSEARVISLPLEDTDTEGGVRVTTPPWEKAQTSTTTTFGNTLEKKGSAPPFQGQLEGLSDAAPLVGPSINADISHREVISMVETIESQMSRPNPDRSFIESRKRKPSTSFSAPEGSQSKDVVMAELKSMKMASLQNRNSAVEAELAASTAKLEEITKELKAPAAETVKEHIKLLHEYNDIRDVGQGLIGMIADNRGVRIGELYEEFGVGLKD